MAAARSREPVLAKIRLMWVLTVWLLRNRCAAISGLVIPRAMRVRISISRCVRPSGPGGASAGAGFGAVAAAARRVACARIDDRQTPCSGVQSLGDAGAGGVLGE